MSVYYGKYVMSFLFADMDEEECSKRRNECLDDMAELERQFSEIREQ